MLTFIGGPSILGLIPGGGPGTINILNNNWHTEKNRLIAY